jgi:hypothetical protein
MILNYGGGERVNFFIPKTVEKFQAFTAVKIQVEVFWIVTPCSDVGYQRFGGPCCVSTFRVKS